MRNSVQMAQQWAFTVAITAISRILMLRDRILRRVRIASAEEASRLTRHTITSGANCLDAVFVTPISKPKAALLICHGVGETVDYWTGAQQLLARQQVASLGFNYSGYGRSTGIISAKQCDRDAIVAFHYLETLLPGQPISLLGYSMGSAVAAAILAKVPARSLILCASFTSLREAACSIGFPRWMSLLLPKIWDTQRSLRACTVPVLLVHGTADRLFPTRMASELKAGCTSPCKLILAAGVGHNQPIFHPETAYWSGIADHLIQE